VISCGFSREERQAPGKRQPTWWAMGGLSSGEKRKAKKSSSVGMAGAGDLVTRRAMPRRP